MAWGITGWSGGPRTPVNYNLRAGQFRGMGRANVFTTNYTIINNNYGGRYGGGFANYGYDTCCHHDCGSSTPKWMNWLMGIGLGTSLLGNILGLFGKKTDVVETPDNNAQKPQITPGSDNTQALDKLNNKFDFLAYQMSLPDDLRSQVSYDPDTGKYKFKDQEFDNLDDLKAAVAKSQTPTGPAVTTGAGDPAGAAKPLANAKKGDYMNCIDDAKNIADIKGKFDNIERNDSGDIIKFTIEDRYTGNKYEFVAAGSTTADGTPQFKCISRNGKAAVQEQIYNLENGSLVQHEGMTGYGVGLKFEEA